MPFGIIRLMENTKLIYPEECYAIRGAIFEVYHELGLLVNFGSYPKATVEHWVA